MWLEPVDDFPKPLWKFVNTIERNLEVLVFGGSGALETWSLHYARYKADTLANKIRAAGLKWIGTMFFPSPIFQPFVKNIGEPNLSNWDMAGDWVRIRLPVTVTSNWKSPLRTAILIGSDDV
eukprot:Gb_25449 [translate_table: standard]